MIRILIIFLSIVFTSSISATCLYADLLTGDSGTVVGKKLRTEIPTPGGSNEGRGKTGSGKSITLQDLSNKIKNNLAKEGRGIDRYYKTLKELSLKGSRDSKAYYKALAEKYAEEIDHISLFIGDCEFISGEYIKAIKRLSTRLGIPLIVYAFPQKGEVNKGLTKAIKDEGLTIHILTPEKAKEEGIEYIPTLKITRNRKTSTITGRVISISDKAIEQGGDYNERCKAEIIKGRVQYRGRYISKLKAGFPVSVHPETPPRMGSRHRKEPKVVESKQITPLVRKMIFFSKEDIPLIKTEFNKNMVYGCCVDCEYKDAMALFRIHSQVCPVELVKKMGVTETPTIIIYK